ncbi:MAG TPA: hypothetical protein VGS20_02320 [Candidatus Acidoferrales bacterium]|nr:hypothetical protein [Candidatus Acidoferrales bacterium]
MDKERLIIGAGIVAVGLAVWQLNLIEQLLAAWVIFAAVFVPLLVVGLGIALFEQAGQRSLARAESGVVALYDGARRRLSHLSWPELLHGGPAH